MLSKTIIATGLTLALSVPALGALALNVDEPAELQEQNQSMVTTQDQVATQNAGDNDLIQIQERNRIHQDTQVKTGEPVAAGEQERQQTRTQDPQTCTNPDCPNQDEPNQDGPNSDGLQNQERNQERNIADKANGTFGPHGPDDSTGPGERNGDGVQDCTGPISESAQDGTGNQYGKK